MNAAPTTSITCQRGHAFETPSASPLPYTCPSCGAPAQPARPLIKPLEAGPVGEQLHARWTG